MMGCCHDDCSEEHPGKDGSQAGGFWSAWHRAAGAVARYLTGHKGPSTKNGNVCQNGPGANLSTPNYVPFNDLDSTTVDQDLRIAQKKQASKWHGSLFSVFRTEEGTGKGAGAESKDEIQLSPIKASPPGQSKSSETTTTKAAVLRPADLWRHDQHLMLQGRYQLDASFNCKYQLKQLLGEGSFGFVWVAERIRDQKEVAVKFIFRDKVPTGNWIFDGELGLVPLEVHFIRRVVHRNVIQFLDYFSDYRFVYLITEMHGTSWTWPNSRIDPSKNPGLRPPGQLLHLSQSSSRESVGVPGVTRRSSCDLFECIEAHARLPEETIRKIFSQIVQAVCYLYAVGIVHRDLKDENIVVDEDYNIKIIDFGSASWIPKMDPLQRELLAPSDFAESQSPVTAKSHGAGGLRSDSIGPLLERDSFQEGYFEKFNGTVAFAAPEVIRGCRYKPSEAEVWSLGVLLYTMAFKKSPFASTESILHARLDLPIEEQPGSPKVRPQCEILGIHDLICCMLQKNPVGRIRLDEIMRHPFMEQPV